MVGDTLARLGEGRIGWSGVSPPVGFGQGDSGLTDTKWFDLDRQLYL